MRIIFSTKQSIPQCISNVLSFLCHTEKWTTSEAAVVSTAKTQVKIEQNQNEMEQSEQWTWFLFSWTSHQHFIHMCFALKCWYIQTNPIRLWPINFNDKWWCYWRFQYAFFTSNFFFVPPWIYCVKIIALVIFPSKFNWHSKLQKLFAMHFGIFILFPLLSTSKTQSIY